LNLDYYDTYSAFRFSPLDVNSRESACLTNFLLSGKCVLLELGNLPSECTVNINEYGEEKNLNTSETDGTSSNNNRLFSHMIISHNQELMIHAIAFGSNNPMSKIGPSYVVTNENETNLSLNELEEYMEEIDDENLEKDLRVDVKTCSFLFLELICFWRVLLILFEQRLCIHRKRFQVDEYQLKIVMFRLICYLLTSEFCLALRLLERHTRRCPLLANETIFFNMPPVNPILKHNKKRNEQLKSDLAC